MCKTFKWPRVKIIKTNKFKRLTKKDHLLPLTDTIH